MGVIQCYRYKQHLHQTRIVCSRAFLNAVPQAKLSSPQCFRQAQGNEGRQVVCDLTHWTRFKKILLHS